MWWYESLDSVYLSDRYLDSTCIKTVHHQCIILKIDEPRKCDISVVVGAFQCLDARSMISTHCENYSWQFIFLAVFIVLWNVLSNNPNNPTREERIGHWIRLFDFWNSDAGFAISNISARWISKGNIANKSLGNEFLLENCSIVRHLFIIFILRSLLTFHNSAYDCVAWPCPWKLKKF